ncbi:MULTISPECIES: hypothetical protein [Deefgea]|uniref:PEP-CTERM sorting domain-containing protein n=1 Tax=Deefgea chitinilytica TaxID=570276 RepID=A0ABS2C808_9NEIS|nr:MULTISPECIES: hypothetical protein [Deefgea]MBM5570281.1 hypothetical protein [Deefgea chitinilytica]MBM9887510.1 hypothetical protein [Deefgea sp. CFH1-16]
MFKSKIASLAVFATLTAASSIASATVITFDELISDTSNQISISYQGFNWDNVYALNGTVGGYESTGYGHGVVSGNNVAYNGYGSPASFSSNTAFTLNDLFITKA